MIWQDRTRTDPTKRKFIDENGNEQNVNIEEIESNITQSGTPVNATTMNNIEKNLGTYGNDTYDSTATYLEGETVTHNALLYRAKQDIETPEEWTAAHWEETSVLDELANTSGNEVLIGEEEDITRQTKIIIEEVPEGSNIPYINSEIAIGSSNNDNRPVWFKKSKNLFNQKTFVSGDITNGNPTIRLSSRQALYLEPGTYTFSTTQPNTFQYILTMQSNGAPPLVSEPTWTYSSSWISDTTKTFTITTPGYFCIYLRKANNTNIALNEISGFNYYLTKGSTATNEDYIAPSIIADNTEFYPQEYYNDTGWINFTDLSNWTNFSWEPIAYRKIGKVVYIHGGGTIGNYSDTTIATLPDGFRPRQNIDVICATNNSIAICKMHIGYNGSIAINYPSNANVKEVLLNTCFVAR